VSYFLNKRPNGHKFVNRVESDTFYSKAEAQTMADEINDLTEFEMKGKLKKGRRNHVVPPVAMLYPET
jgi:hypothetical protein